MGLNINQNAIFKSLVSGEVALISQARGISVLADSTGTVTIATLFENGDVASSMDLPASQSVEITADGGNLLQTIRVTCNGDTANLVTLGGAVEIE
jgi:hypothetical protein